ncbi:ATP-dependent zinc protease [Vibrio sp. HN007]|uniref:ATP-dependent zinc protease family protein n=1 Tax=Vibrio iocasae TaxID=3098914 RepID=UPI0035D46263
MKTTVLSLVVLSLLSGCTLTNGEKYSKDTIDAIQQSETNLNQKLSIINLAVSNQSDYIESLEDEVVALKQEMVYLEQKIEQDNAKASGQSQKKAQPAENKNVSSLSQTTVSDELIVLGAIESVTIDSLDKSFDARIDTGAKTSSLNAIDLQEFEREGKTWVRFHLNEPSAPKGEQDWIEAPVQRYVNIRQVSSENKLEKRPVIELWVKIGNIHEKSQFTLADRSHMSHSILLGREFIKDIAVVDVSKRFLLSTSDKNNQS